jgi:hypothetical protein
MLIPPLAMLLVSLLQPPQQAPVILFQNEYAADPVAVLRQTKIVEAVPAKSSLEGTWYRDGTGYRLLVTFKGNRFTSELQGYNDEAGELVKATIESDFTLNSENLVYGVVTGFDCNQHELKLDWDWVTGMPFSFRVRRDGNSLSIRELKAAMPKNADAPWPTGDLSTRYTLVDEKNPLPALKKQAVQMQQYREDPLVRVQQLREQSEEYRQVSEPVRQPLVPEQTKNDPRVPIHGPTMDERHVATQAVSQHPGSVLPVTSVAPPVAKPTLHGTWIRNYKGAQLVLRINPDSVTLTATQVIEAAPGQQLKISQFLAADSAIGKDGITLFGVVTGVDTQVDGSMPGMKMPEPGSECEKKMQAMIGQPILMTLRVYNNQLLVSKMRIGNTGGPESVGDAIGQGFSGRYEFLGDKPVPAPKPMTGEHSSGHMIKQYTPESPSPLGAAASNALPTAPPPLQTAPPTQSPPQPLPQAPAPTTPAPPTQSPPQPEASCESPEPAQAPATIPPATSSLPPFPPVSPQQAEQSYERITPVPQGMAYVLDPVTKKVELQPFQRAPHSAPPAAPLQPSSYEFYDRKLGTMVRVTDLPATASRGAQLPSAMTPQPLPRVPQPMVSAEAVEGFSTLASWVLNSLAKLGLVQTIQKGYTLPSPHYLNHYPQYFPADPSSPSQRERASMEEAPAPRRANWQPTLELFLQPGRGKNVDTGLFPARK